MLDYLIYVNHAVTNRTFLYGSFFLQMTFTKVCYRRFHQTLFNRYSDIHYQGKQAEFSPGNHTTTLYLIEMKVSLSVFRLVFFL